MKLLFKIPYYLLLVGVVSVALLLLATLVPIPGNFKVKIVKSGSMEPTIMTGGIVVIRPAPIYKVGDVITFGPDTKTQIPTTHRIVAETGNSSSKFFTTKGDANDANDSEPTKISDVNGKVIFDLPYVGYVLDFAKKPLGFFLLVGIPALIVILDEIGKIWTEIRRIRSRKRKDNGGDTGIRPRILDLRPRQQSRSEIRVVERSEARSNTKLIATSLIVIGSLVTLSSTGSTTSYYNEKELSLSNMLQARSNYDREVVLEDEVPVASLTNLESSTESLETTLESEEVIEEEKVEGEVLEETPSTPEPESVVAEEVEVVETEEPVVEETTTPEIPVEVATEIVTTE